MKIVVNSVVVIVFLSIAVVIPAYTHVVAKYSVPTAHGFILSGVQFLIVVRVFGFAIVQTISNSIRRLMATLDVVVFIFTLRSAVSIDVEMLRVLWAFVRVESSTPGTVSTTYAVHGPVTPFTHCPQRWC